VRALCDRGALDDDPGSEAPLLAATGGPGPVVAVIAEPDHRALAQELCGAAARLAESLSGSTVLLASDDLSPATAGSWGADRLVHIRGAAVEEDIAGAVIRWARSEQPWAILAGSTASGREIAARVAAAIGAGLTGDAVDLEVADARLVAWKAAFGGQLVAAITATSPVQMTTVRAGVLPRPQPRVRAAEVASLSAFRHDRVSIRSRRQDDSLERLGEAGAVIGVGTGVTPEELARLETLRELLGAEFGCTRKVTDRGWMPHASQIGITGRSIAPRLYVAIGTSGKFNHMVGVRAAGTVLAINQDPTAPVWDYADVGIVADWRECIDMLDAEVKRECESRQLASAERSAAKRSLSR